MMSKHNETQRELKTTNIHIGEQLEMDVDCGNNKLTPLRSFITDSFSFFLFFCALLYFSHFILLLLFSYHINNTQKKAPVNIYFVIRKIICKYKDIRMAKMKIGVNFK